MSVKEDVQGGSADDAQLPAVADPALTEDAALALLKRADLPPEVFEQLSKNGTLAKSRKVKLALVTHGKTPRHVSLPMVRHLYTFDLMKVALTPAVPADVKIAARPPRALMTCASSVPCTRILCPSRIRPRGWCAAG